VALGESAKVVWSNILNAPFINFAGGDMPLGDQVAQPLRGVWIELVVIRAAHARLNRRVHSCGAETPFIRVAGVCRDVVKC
jgi:hypothetical protein